MDWSKYDLVVIDESHNFRNATADRRDENGNIIRRSRYNTLKNALRAGRALQSPDAFRHPRQHLAERHPQSNLPDGGGRRL